MADEGLDPCECIWNHELAMRRLLSLIRQGQSYCTDNECFEEVPGVDGAANTGNNFMMMFMMMALAVALYVMRPRQQPQLGYDMKPANDGQGPSGAPPTPPPATN